MKEEDQEVVYPPWMLQDSANPELAPLLNQKANEAFADALEVTSPSQDLGRYTHINAKGEESRVGAFMVHAVDPIFMSDDGRVIVIKRKGEPDKDKYAFPGGLLEQGDTPVGEPIDIRKIAVKELAEEVGLDVSYEKGEVIGTRKIERHPRDIRIVSGVPAHYQNVVQYGVKPGDLMLITTQAVVFQVSGEELDRIAGTLQARSDAREVAVKNIAQLLRDKEMGLDHGILLQEAVEFVGANKRKAHEMATEVGRTLVMGGARVGGQESSYHSSKKSRVVGNEREL